MAQRPGTSLSPRRETSPVGKVSWRSVVNNGAAPARPTASPVGKVSWKSRETAVDAADEPAAPRSLWEQVNPVSLASQAVRGVGSLAKSVVEQPFHMAQLPLDLARGVGLPIPGESDMDWSGNMLQDIQAGFREYSPLAADLSTSFARTANVTGIGSQKNIIGRYQEAVDEGRWVDELLEDAGNAAIVAGGVGKALGSVAGASLAPESASALLRRAAARDTAKATAESLLKGRGTSPTSGAMMGQTKALSSQWRPPMRMLPPEVPIVTDLSYRLPGSTRTALPLVERVEDALAARAITTTPGRGLAGYLERQALPDMSDTARVASRADGVGAPPAAQAAANAGARARQLSMAAQWVDPAESLVALGGKALGGAGKLVGKAAPRLAGAVTSAGANADAGQASWTARAQQRIHELSTEGTVRQDLDTNRANMEREAIQFQNFVDTNLKSQGIDQAQRDLYGGIILDATDLSLDARAKVWRQMADDPPEMRAAALRLWNEGRGDKFAITPERLDLYNDFLDGKLDPKVTEVLKVGLERLRSAELNRRTTQLATGNVRMEQLEVPYVRREYNGTSVKVPYTELSPGEISQALADGTLIRPWLGTKTKPRQARLAEIVGEKEAALEAAEAKLDPVARELDAVMGFGRYALPVPGTSVNWWDTADGRSRIIDQGHRRIEELEVAIEDAIATAEIDADISTEIAGLREQIRAIDDEIARTQEIADISAEQMMNSPAPRKPPVKVSSLDDGAAIREAAERYQQEMHAAAVSDHDAMFGESPPNLTPPRRKKPDGRWETQDDWGGQYDTFRHDSPIWSNRRARRWYTMQGWFSKGGRARGLAPDEWASVVARRNSQLAGASLDEMAVAYLDSIDRIYATRSKKAIHDEVVEQMAVQLQMDPALVEAALRGKRPYTAAQRATVEQALADLSEQFLELDIDARARIIADLRSLDELDLDADTRMTALMEMLSDELGVAERELFGEIVGQVDVDGLVRMLDSGEIQEAAWRSAMQQIDLSTEQRAQIQALIDRASQQVSGIDQSPVIQRSLAQVAKEQLDLPDPLIGTNPTPGNPWEPWSEPRGVVPRSVAVAAGAPDIASGPIRPDAENIIRREADLRRQIDEIERDIWIAGKELAVARERSDNFIQSLDRSQQEMLVDNANKGIAALSSKVKNINTSGEKVGGYMLDGDGVGKLTGGIAKMAGKLNLEARVLALTEIRLQRMWESMHKNLLIEDYPNGFPTLEQFIATQRKRLTERENAAIAFEVLVEQADKFLPGSTSGKTWAQGRGALESAYTADKLGRILARYFNRGGEFDSPMAGHAAMRALDNAIREMPEWQRRHVGKDRLDEINAAYTDYQARFHRELSASVNRHLTYAPAVFRTPLQEARRMVAAHLTEADRLWSQKQYGAAEALYRLVEDAPTSFAMYVEQGGAVPIHLIAGDGSGVARRVPGKNAPDEVNVARVKATQERQLGYRVPSLREYAGIEAYEMTQIASQQSVLALAFDPTFSAAAADIPGVREAVADWHRGQTGGKKMPFRKFQEILAERGYAVVKGATEDTMPGKRGQVAPLEFNEEARLDLIDDPGDPFQRIVVEDPMEPGRRILVDYDQLDTLNTLPNVRVVPDYIAPVINDYLSPTSNRWLLMYDQMTQLWKTATLAWSVAWVTYNAIGNAIMATFSYGQGPFALMNNLSTIRLELAKLNEAAGYGSAKPLRTAMKNDTLSALVPSRMGAHGQSWAERASTMRVREYDTTLGKALDYATQPGRPGWKGLPGRITEFSYTLNEFTDNMFRTTVLMEDAARRLGKEAAIPPELLTVDGRLRTDLNPTEQAQLDELGRKAEKALEDSTRAALNTMGDFTRLNRYERNYIKRAIPFYPWLRHQTAMAFRIPIQNPLRWAWMASLQGMLQDEDDPHGAMANLMSSMIMTPIGGISLAAANPLSKGMTSFGSEEDGKAFFDPGSFTAAINPLPKFVSQVVRGVDENQGAAVSRPADQKTLNQFGQLEGTSALGRIMGGDVLGGLGEVGYTALGLTPQTRGLRDVALGPAARYDSGDEIDYADDRPGGRLLSLAKAARIPFIPTDVSQLVETAEERDAQAARAARRRRFGLASVAGPG